jgi:glycosyltransferase involved in cell wall biosynthesis
MQVKNKKSNMKILLVCKSLPTRSQGGIQTHVWKLSENLVNLGHNITILTAGSWRNGLKKSNIEGRTIIEIPYLPLFRQPIMPMFLEELSFNMSAKRWTQKHESEFDIIHLQGRSGFLYPQKNHKVPIISTFHGLVTIENKRAMRPRNVELLLHEQWANWYEKKTVKNSDALIAVSTEMLDELVHLSRESLKKTSCISNGVDCNKELSLFAEPKNKIKTEGEILVFVGRIDRIKGIYNLVQAIKKVEYPLQLVMIGDSFEFDFFKKHIETEGLSERIFLTGALPNEEVLAWIQRSYALILPSFHETQGIVLLEANACGKPVLASRVAGILEVVSEGKNGLLFNPHDIDDIAHTIDTLFKMPKKAKEMGEYGKKMVEKNYTWDKIALQTVDLYEKTVSEFALKQLPYVRGLALSHSH